MHKMTDETTNQGQFFEKSTGSTNVNSYKFEPNPIKGYPILAWTGKRPFKSTNYFPAQLKEVYGEEVDGWRNKIYWGDNLQVMSHLLREYRGKIDLIYIDPPFDSKADYKKKITLRGKDVNNEHTSFEDKQYSDIWNNDEYLQFIYERIILLRELLSNKGCLLVHCDYRVNSYIRLILDEIFGKDHFVNEIVWAYRSGGASKKESLPKKHDNIYFYKKNEFNVNLIYERQYLEKPFMESKIDNEGRYYVDTILRDIIEGLISSPQSDGSIKYYNTRPVLNLSKERLDYPTQKPEGLLEVLIDIATNPGDLVADLFCGSGTTQAVALKRGRRFIGADINVGAIQTTTKRLLSIVENLRSNSAQSFFPAEEEYSKNLFTGFEVYNVNNYDVFRNPVEAKDILISALELHRFESGNLYDGEKDGRLYKVMPVNRITTRSDLNELIMGFDYKAFDRRQSQNPGKAVENITLVCMGHEPDLAAELITEVKPYNIDVQVLDILREKQDLQFKRDSEARVSVNDGYLHIDAFYPMNLLQKLSLQKENVEDWREMVESVMVDWNYDGAVLQPSVVDIPEKNELVIGTYKTPHTAGTIRVKITDLLSESLEIEVSNGEN